MSTNISLYLRNGARYGHTFYGRLIETGMRRFEPTPPLFGAPVGVISLEFHGDFWHQKTRVPGLSYGVVSVILGLAVFVELRLVTDRQTDTR